MLLTARARALNGAAFLDAKMPDWWRGINVKTLDIGSSRACVMGQLHRDYQIGLRIYKISPRGSRRLGFHRGLFCGFGALNAAWSSLVAERQRNAGLAAA